MTTGSNCGSLISKIKICGNYTLNIPNICSQISSNSISTSNSIFTNFLTSGNMNQITSNSITSNGIMQATTSALNLLTSGNNIVDTKNSSNKTLIGIIVGVVVGGIVIIVIIGLILYKRNCKNINNHMSLPRNSINDADLELTPINKGYNAVNTMNMNVNNPQMLKTKEYGAIINSSITLPENNMLQYTENELKYSDVNIERELGSGAFGIVYLGLYNNKNVAIKTVQNDLLNMDLDNFMREAKLMMGVSQHKNVIQILGFCSDPFCIITEFAEHGDLKAYLIKKKKHITFTTMINIIRGIAAGMSHIHKSNIMHKDLAARNILLDANNNAKISDFGLSKQVNDKEYYKLINKTKLPIKWYDPIVFYDHKYTQPSDVWSFGITSWEVLTYGKDPYEGFDNDMLVNYLNSGQRLDIPNIIKDGEVAHKKLWKIILRCWEMDQKKRPTFPEIVQKLTKICY